MIEGGNSNNGQQRSDAEDQPRLFFGCVSLAQIQLVLCYIIMISLNGYAMAKYERAATDGHAVSYVQPDATTFSIWGVIYSLLLLLCLNANRLYPQVRTMICTSFLLNGLWLITNGLAVVEGLSYWSAVSVLAAYAVFLWLSYFYLDVDYKGASLTQRAVVYAPLSLNLTWVTLAVLLNLSNTAMNEKLDFSKKENRTSIGGPDWAIGIFTLSALIAGYLSLIRSDFVYGLGTIWALQGVARYQTKGAGFPHSVSDRVRDFAQVTSVLLGFFIVIGMLRMLFYRRYASNRSEAKPLCLSPRNRDVDMVVRELKTRFVPLNDSYQ